MALNINRRLRESPEPNGSCSSPAGTSSLSDHRRGLGGIERLVGLGNELADGIGCGRLLLRSSTIFKPGDVAAARGAGARS